jgi:hypothetical protein
MMNNPHDNFSFKDDDEKKQLQGQLLHQKLSLEIKILLIGVLVITVACVFFL